MIWLSDMRYFNDLNEVWGSWVSVDHAPVRACVEARLANPNLLVEIQVTAVKKQ